MTRISINYEPPSGEGHAEGNRRELCDGDEASRECTYGQEVVRTTKAQQDDITGRRADGAVMWWMSYSSTAAPVHTDPNNRLNGQHRNFLFEPYCNWAESKLKTDIRINAKANLGVVDHMRLQGDDKRPLYHDNPRVYHVMVRLHKIMALTYSSASFALDSQLRFSFVWLSEFLSKGLEWSQEWRSTEVLG